VKGERKRKKMRKVTVGVSMIKVQYMQAWNDRGKLITLYALIKRIENKRAGEWLKWQGNCQAWGPEFKPPYCKKERNWKKKNIGPFVL
jgi:hypothetical protein